MSAQCHACSQHFSSSRGLNNHLRYCKELSGWEQQLKRHLEDHETSKAAKMIRTADSADLEHADHHSVSDGGSASKSSPLPASFSFSGRKRRVPRALKDYVLHSLAGLAAHLRPAPPRPSPVVPSAPSPVSVPEPELEPGPLVTTEPNGFGLYRQYTRVPRADPEDHETLEDMCDLMESAREPELDAITTEFFHPFPNATVFRLLNWFYH
jgi:hypothetical protein